jgi:hypothetical protein
LRILQSVIVVLGVLIIGGFAFIGVEVYQRATDPTHPRAFGKAPADAPAIAASVIDSLPAGTEIGDPVAVGSRIAVRVVLPDGTQQLLVIEAATGKANIVLKAPPGVE